VGASVGVGDGVGTDGDAGASLALDGAVEVDGAGEPEAWQPTMNRAQSTIPTVRAGWMWSERDMIGSSGRANDPTTLHRSGFRVVRRPPEPAHHGG
jgi:hypothetical protein